MKSRIEEEKEYWNSAAKDAEVEKKYISDIESNGFTIMIEGSIGPVLEIGCGIGRLMKDGWFGIDISEEMIKIAKGRNPSCTFKVCNGREIPFKKCFFNSAYCILVFQHIPLEGIRAYIKELARVLRSNAVFTFQFIEGDEDESFSKHHKLNDILEILNDNWFEVDSIKKGYIHDQWTWIKAIKL